MDEPRELDVGDVSRGAVDALKIPDGLGTVRVSRLGVRLVELSCTMPSPRSPGAPGHGCEIEGDYERGRINLIQEAATIVLVKHAREPPRLVLERLDIHDLDEQQVTRLGILNLERPAEVVNLGQVDIEHVICRVIVADLAAGPSVIKLRMDTLNERRGKVWVYQSTHSILTVSPFLMVPAKGTWGSQCNLMTCMYLGQAFLLTIGMPSVLDQLFVSTLSHPSDGSRRTYMQARLLRSRLVQADLVRGTDTSFAHLGSIYRRNRIEEAVGLKIREWNTSLATRKMPLPASLNGPPP